MGIVLTAIALGGVFNTVLLETRQRTRELAVLKAIGLTPVQVSAMVVASIVPVGILAGLIGVPLGLVAQRAVLGYMGQVAAQTGIPPAVFDVFAPPRARRPGPARPGDRRPRRPAPGGACRTGTNRARAPGGVAGGSRGAYMTRPIGDADRSRS